MSAGHRMKTLVRVVLGNRKEESFSFAKESDKFSTVHLMRTWMRRTKTSSGPSKCLPRMHIMVPLHPHFKYGQISDGKNVLLVSTSRRIHKHSCRSSLTFIYRKRRQTILRNDYNWYACRLATPTNRSASNNVQLHWKRHLRIHTTCPSHDVQGHLQRKESGVRCCHSPGTLSSEIK